MANYLRFAGAVLDEIESGLSTRRIILQLNDAQCSRLLGNLRKTHDHLYQSLLFPTRTLRQKCLPFYKEFYRIVEDTEAIVKECSKPDWLEAAIMQAGNQEVFIQMSRKLHFCINGFTETVEPVLHICSNITFTAPSVTVEKHESDENFSRDSSKFMERLKEVRDQQVSQDTIIDPRKHQLTEYLIERESCMSSANLDLYTSLPQFYVAKGEYPRVGEPIGHGSAGSVLKVRWLGLECAKKHFATNPHESNSRGMSELKKEVSALVHLNHPHIVKLLCVSMEGEVSFLMELMPMSLHNFIKKRWKGQEYVPFTLAAATDIMLQIALGMEYLHGKGVVHRDLKSQNILITPSACEGLSDEGYGDIKVTDFGLSKTLTHELTEPTGILGTRFWMAPEVLKEGLNPRLEKGLKPKIDWRKADTYSFAMTCSEILTGATPLAEGDCRIAMLYERITKGGERPELPSACPKFLASLLTQCWDTNPALRPSFTKICYMLQLLQGYLLRGSGLIHKSWSLAETSSMDQTSALRRATRPEQDILVKVGLSSLKQLKLDTFFRSSKIFRSQLTISWPDREVLSSIFMGNFAQPVGLRGVQIFEFNSSLNYDLRKEFELTMAKCRYFVEGMKALTDNPRNHLVKLQYWHYTSFRDSDQNKLYVVYDAWSSTLYEHLSGLKKTLPWNKRLHILAGLMACVVYFIELIELNVVSSISLSSKSILLDKSYNLHFTDVSLVEDAGIGDATNGDNVEGMVYEIGIFIMEVLGGIRKHHTHTLDRYARRQTQPEGPEWVQGLIEPRLNTDYHAGQADTLLTLGLMCLNPNKHERPTIWSARDIITSTVHMETKLTRSQVQGQFPALHFLEYNSTSEYTCQEVRDITSNFLTPKRYGKYLGILSTGEKVLVDQLHPSSASPKEFINQVKMYTKVPTWGLVMSPIGFCVEEGERILIYRDMETMPAEVYLEDDRAVSLITTKPLSIALQIARGLNSLCNMDIILHNTTFDNIHVTRNGSVMIGLQFEEENSLTKSEKLSEQLEDFGTILGQLVCGPKWQSTFGTPMHLKNMAVDIEHFVDPGFHKFNNLAMSQLAILASLCLEEGHAAWSRTVPRILIKVFEAPYKLEKSWTGIMEEGHARLSMVNIIQKLEEMVESWTAHAGTLELITSYETIAREFTLHELDATYKNFGLERLPGEGETGWMRLEAKLERSGFRQVLGMRQLYRKGLQDYHESLVVVLLQSLLYHQNLVNLIGYCADGNRLFLLYDCDPSAFLEDRLCDLAPQKRPLDWKSRMYIAYGVARGLEYLHDKASPPVIYGNLNSSDVFLDYKSSPKLSGFGLADLRPPGSDVNGNDGYCAPEYAITRQFTFKSDVYSFGVVLLELITGRRAIDNARAAGEQNLVAWVELSTLLLAYIQARPFFKGSHKNFPSILDPEHLAFTLDLAARCLEQDAVARPPIKDVVSKMQGYMVRAGLSVD